MGVLKYFNGTEWIEAIVGVQGATGPVGATGPTGGTFLYSQLTPRGVWPVVHNLESRYLNVEVVDINNYSYVGKYNYPEIYFEDNNSLKITFTVYDPNELQIGTYYEILTNGNTDFTTVGSSLVSAGAFVTNTLYVIKTLGTVNWTSIGAEAFDPNDLVIGEQYVISAVGATDWTALGAASNTVGVTFIATATGSADPTASAILSKFTATGIGTGIGDAYTAVFVATGAGAGTGTLAEALTGYAAISCGGVGATGPSLPYRTTSTTTMELATGPLLAGNFISGTTYRIFSVGTTDFTVIGAPDNNIGTIFTASFIGADPTTGSSGSAQILQECFVDLSLAYTTGQNLVCSYDVNNYMVGVVDSYDPGTGALAFFAVGGIGSGVYSAWDINIFTAQGATGLTGATGATGPMGPPGAVYLHTQATSTTVWTVNHNLGFQYVNIEPVDSSGISFVGRYDYPTINFVNANTLTLTFTTAQSGYASISAGGPQGATGATGPLGSSYVHTQSSPASVWTVNHYLDQQYVVVEPIDNTGKSYNGRYDFPQIDFIDNNTLTLTFSTAVTGYAAVTSGGPVGATGATGVQGATGVAGVAQNVLYVSKSGNDANSGTDLTHAKLTIASAVTAANALQALNPTGMTCIFVKAGDYTEVNPISLSAGVSIVGDNLRAVNVRPSNPTQDIFWVKNRCYLTGMTFRDHLTPAAAVAFPSSGAGFIVTSPYIQNCSSITTTGAGMRVDGSLASGLRSMVLDSYTQFNQGGLGIHITNQGYAQLVSIFTICCTAGVKCEAGGTCSITNSNNSFGDYGLWADGVGPTLYSGTLVSNTRDTLTVSGLTTRPAVNDAVLITDGVTSQYILVREATPLAAGVSTITFSEDLTLTPTPGPVNFMQISLISASSQTFEYVGTGTNILTSTPRLGGVPIQANEIRQTNGGRVNYTSTDQFGDFRIGDGLLISEEAGVIEGTTFDRSLFAVLTPYILALEG